MHLEDHLGDILRKARTMAGVSSEAVAKAAGLTGPELAALEDSGDVTKKINFTAVAPLIELNPGKLEGIAKGWLPAENKLSTWRELRQISTTERGNQVHCYLIWDTATREAAAFDTGWTAEPILELVRKNQLQLKHLFITHTHPDHIAGMAKIQKAISELQVHTDARSASPEQRNRSADSVPLGGLRITNRDTPGHADDGVTYVIDRWPDQAPPVAIVGDAIFAGSMGGAAQAGALAKQKIRDHILSLPPDTLICPGHGPLTTVGEEQKSNPFF
jgi:glyoxylase-like metal-dependent hydrolase (beta-lactamase superfamily II)